MPRAPVSLEKMGCDAATGASGRGSADEVVVNAIIAWPGAITTIRFPSPLRRASGGAPQTLQINSPLTEALPSWHNNSTC